MKRRRISCLLIAVGLLVGLAACSDDDNPVEVPKSEPTVFTSSAAVMDAFDYAIQNKNTGAMDAVLHPDFRLILQAETIQEYPSIGAEMDRAGQMRAVSRMFGGLDLFDQNGDFLSAIDSMNLDLFEQQGQWSEIGAGQDFAGCSQGMFDVILHANRLNTNSISVRGLLVVYLAREDAVVDGAVQTSWSMAGIRDLTDGGFKGVETTPWGTLQALYWTAE